VSMYIYNLNVFISVDLKRSKSTPGLVESSGKVPMHSSSITRHHTLPAGLPTTHSASTNQAGPPEQTDSSTIPGTTDASHVHISEAGDQRIPETQMRTVSSVTSIFNGTPSVRSPINVDNQTPMFHFSPPLTPGIPPQFQTPYIQHTANLATTCVSQTPPYSEYISRDVSQDIGSRMAAAQYQQMHYPYPQQFNSQIPSTGFNANHQPIAYLSPFCASPAFVSPVSPPCIPVSRNNSTSAQSNQSYSATSTPHGTLQPTADGHPSSIPAHIYTEASHDTLVEEITRLRERLKSVESENAMMAAKLNQQQWELEHRLSELEMHMTCTSDLASTSSTDDRSNPFENISRESMI